MTRPTHLNQITLCPLVWPDEKPRTAQRDRKHNRRGWDERWSNCVNSLKKELYRADMYDWRLSAERSGAYSSRSSVSDDPGIALWFMQNVHGNWALSVLACDKFLKPAMNVKAIAMTIQRLRLIEEYGCYSSEQAMRGAAYDALPPPEAPPKPWWEVLGVAPDAEPWLIEAVYKAAAKRHHPDAGGDAEMFKTVNRAYQEAKTEMRM